MSWPLTSLQPLSYSELASVTLPAGVRTIDSSAFFSCESLATISIPRNVRHIGEGAFSSTACCDTSAGCNYSAGASILPAVRARVCVCVCVCARARASSMSRRWSVTTRVHTGVGVRRLATVGTAVCNCTRCVGPTTQPPHHRRRTTGMPMSTMTEGYESALAAAACMGVVFLILTLHGLYWRKCPSWMPGRRRLASPQGSALCVRRRRCATPHAHEPARARVCVCGGERGWRERARERESERAREQRARERKEGDTRQGDRATERGKGGEKII